MDCANLLFVGKCNQFTNTKFNRHNAQILKFSQYDSPLCESERQPTTTAKPIVDMRSLKTKGLGLAARRCAAFFLQYTPEAAPIKCAGRESASLPALSHTWHAKKLGVPCRDGQDHDL